MSIATSTLDSTDRKRFAYRRYAVIALYALSAFWGVAQLVATHNSLLNIVSGLGFATFATFWFVIDRRILTKPQLPILNLLFFFTWPIASLIHLLASRGARGLEYWGLNAFGLFATMCLTFFPAIILLNSMGLLDVDAVATP